MPPTDTEVPLQAESHTSDNIPAGVWQELQTCAEQWSLDPLQSAPWLKSTLPSVRVGTIAHLVIVRDSAGAPVAFWPVAIERDSANRVLPIRVCRPWERDVRYATWAITNPELSTNTARATVQRFFDCLPVWHKMHTGLIPLNSPIHDPFHRELSRRTLPIFGRIYSSTSLVGWKDFDTFLDGISVDWGRKRYRRYVTREIEAGRLAIEFLTGSRALAALPATLDRIMRIYRESWKVTSDDQNANLTNPEAFRRFSSLCTSFARKDALHVVIARCENDDAAFWVGVHSGSKYASIQTAYKETYSKQSVGYVVLMENARHVIESGFRQNDLLGVNDYKRHYNPQRIDYSMQTVSARNLRGALAFLLAHSRACVKKAVPS